MIMAIETKPNLRLVKCRETAKLSQGEVASTIGVDQTAISKYERGIFFPKADKMIKLARLYNVPVEWLFFSND